MKCVLIPDALQIINATIPKIHCRSTEIIENKEYPALKKLDFENVLKCSICLQLFDGLGSFSVHFLQQHKTKSVEEDLRIDQQEVATDLVPKNSNDCTICWKKFSKRQLLLRHVRRVHEEVAPYTCKYCSKHFPKRFHGLEHERSAHRLEVEKEKTYLCKFCPRGFDLKSNLDSHERSHAKGELKCCACSKEFTHIFKRKNHERKYHKLGSQKSVERLICDICKGSFARKDSLLQHMRRHMQDRQEKHICEFCAKEFPWPENLKFHIKQVHNRSGLDKRVKCDLCELLLASVNCLRSHRKHVHGVTGQLYKRNLTFVEKSAISNDSKEPVKCHICQKTFANYHQFRLHELKHSKTFTCNFCGAQLTSESKLVRHQNRYHQMPQNVDQNVLELPTIFGKICDICNITFSRTNDLIKHRQEVHSIVEVIECQMCQKSFILPNQYKLHMRSHESSNHTICKVCNKEFKSERSCYMHRHHSHPETIRKRHVKQTIEYWEPDVAHEVEIQLMQS